MKKFLAILVVFAMVAGAVFADNPELSVSVSGKASTNIFYATNGTGEWDTGASGDAGSGKISELQKGSTDFLSYNDGTGTDGWDVGIGFTLSVENAEAGVNFLINKNEKANDFGTNNDGDPAFVLGDFLFLDGWHLSGNVGAFDGYVGTGDYKGKASAVGGINNPFWTEDKVELGNLNFVDSGLFAVGFQPSDMFKIALGTGITSFGEPNAFGSRSAINASFLVSLINLGEVVTFDVFYGIKGEDKDTLTSPAGNGKWTNRFGLYADLNLSDTLGIFLGYSAAVDVVESKKGGTKMEDVILVNNPLYSGIDLNISFSGIDNFGIHFNNNLSFAGAEGTDGKDIINNGLTFGDSFAGGAPLGEDAKDTYSVYIGELGGTYSVSEALGIGLILTEKLGTYEQIRKSGKDTDTTTLTKNYFEAFLKASYSIGPVSLSSGLCLGLTSFDSLATSDKSGAKDQTQKLSVTTFSIPVLFTVAF